MDKIIEYAEEIKRIIEDALEIQNSQESEYTKKCAKIHAFDDLVELLR